MTALPDHETKLAFEVLHLQRHQTDATSEHNRLARTKTNR